MVARRALAFLMSCLVAACGGDDGSGRSGGGGGPGSGPVFVDAAAEPGGDGTLDAPVATLDEAFAVAATLGVERPRVVVLAGAYDVPTVVLGALAPRIDGAGPDVTRFVAADATWSSDGALELVGVTVEGAMQIDARGLDLTSVDVAPGGALTMSAADAVRYVGGASAGPLAIADTPTVSVSDAGFEGGTLAIERAKTATLINVTVRDSVGTGIRVTDVSEAALLTRVQVYDVTAANEPDEGTGGDEQPVDGVGLLVERSSAELDDVLVVRTAFRGVDIREGAVSMNLVTIAGGGAAGLAVQGGAVVDAEQLTINDAGTLVFSAGADTTLRDASLSDGSLSCMLVSGGGRFVLSDSTVLDCPQGHLSVLNDVETSVLSNVFVGADASACVSVASNTAPVRIEGNSISECAGSGIGVLEVTDMVVLDNRIDAIVPDPFFVDVADGLTIVDATVTVQSNRIERADGTGVSLLRSTGLVAENVMTDLGDAGVRAVDPRTGGDRLRVVDNAIAASTAAGVVVFGTGALVEGNTISDTAFDASDGLGDGLVVGLGADVEIVDNTIERSGANGLLAVDGVTGRVAGNRFVDNAGYGVREFCTDPSARVELAYEANTYRGNLAGETWTCE